MKKYEFPELEVVVFDTADVITTSDDDIAPPPCLLANLTGIH